MSVGSAVTLGSVAYAQRQKRVMDAIELREPDRLPTILFSHFWAAHYSGMNCRGFILDAGIGVPDEAKPENVPAMYACAKECAY